MNADVQLLICVHPRSSAVSFQSPRLPLAAVAARLAFLAADLAAAPWLGHVFVSFPASSVNFDFF
jgi:hypothetical protein